MFLSFLKKILGNDLFFVTNLRKRLSKKIVNDNKTIVLIAFTGLIGQEKYELTLRFGDIALSRYARDLDISECLINSENTKWLNVDIGKRKITIQLT